MWRLEPIDKFLSDLNISYYITRELNGSYSFETLDKKYKISAINLKYLLELIMGNLGYIQNGYLKQM